MSESSDEVYYFLFTVKHEKTTIMIITAMIFFDDFPGRSRTTACGSDKKKGLSSTWGNWKHSKQTMAEPWLGCLESTGKDGYQDTETESKDLFNFKTKSILKKEIVTHDITEEAGIDNVNVLLLGEIGNFSRNGFVQ